MTETKFTPGPWNAETTKWKPLIMKEETCILAETWESDIISRDEANANATLIAAAPEMYDALQKIASMTPGTSCDTDDGCSYYESECGTCYEMIGIAQDALRKARGESEVSQ